MLGAPTGDSLTYTTVAEQARAFTTFSLQPWLTRIEEALNTHEAFLPPNHFVAFELGDLLRGNPAERASFYESGIRAGWLDTPTIRRWENLLPLEEVGT
jgi:phage portal protein BeeE